VIMVDEEGNRCQSVPERPTKRHRPHHNPKASRRPQETRDQRRGARTPDPPPSREPDGYLDRVGCRLQRG
jgi:hypothetical protein